MKVYSTAYKNVVSHMDDIKKDADALEKDFDKKDYFGTADMASSIARIALPVPKSLGDTVCYEGWTLTNAEVADFLAGFVAGFTGNDHKEYFETCIKDTPEFEKNICTAINDITTKDNQQVLKGVKLIMSEMPEMKKMLDGCPKAKADIDTTEGWYKYWKSQGEMKVYSTAYKNVVNNMSTIKKDANTMEDDFDKKDYYGTADMASSVARIALPVPKSVGAVDCYEGFELNTVEVADFLAGFVHGFTGKDHKDYFETCIKDTDSFEKDICDAVADFATKDNQKVLAGVKKVLKDMPDLKGFLDGCPDAKDDIEVTENWFKYWKGQGEMKVYSTIYKNVVANMSTIKKDADTMEDDFDKKDFYGTADMAASVAKIALPVQSMESLQ